MRRWALTAAVVLIIAALGAYALFPARHGQGRMASRMAEVGLVLLDDDAGLYVLGVIDGSLAGNAGIRPGDYLTSAQGIPLTTASQLEELLSPVNGRSSLPLTVSRHDQTVTVQLSVP